MTVEERRLLTLTAVVERYIDTGEPVGSKYVAERMNNAVSSATIRNDMAALEARGLLDHRHTSSGRMPSHAGYRAYVNRAMRLVPIGPQERSRIDALFNVRDADPDRLLADAAQSLADYTGLAAVTATVLRRTATVRSLDIVPAGPNAVVILLIASSGVIRNKVCRVDFTVSEPIVRFFKELAAAQLVGKSLDEITTSYLTSLTVPLGGEYSRLFLPIFTAIYELVREINGGQLNVRGTTNLLGCPDLVRTQNELLRFFEDRGQMQRIMALDEVPMRVTIGRENNAAPLEEASLLLSRCPIGSNAWSLIGVVGPVRMDYARLLPRIEYFGRTLARLLSEIYTEEGKEP